MYVRPSTQVKHGMKLPENYSGNAFSQKPQYSDMPPPVRTPSHIRDNSEYGSGYFGDIPPEEIKIYSEPQSFTDPPEEHQNISAHPSTAPPAAYAPASIFSSLLPRGGFGKNFPFGHGIGSEELLILSVMLMVFMSGSESGDTDGELLLLLGLLLFAG